jgi:hypothetical protein
MSGFNSLNMSSVERKELTLNAMNLRLFKLANKGKYAIIDELNVKQGDSFLGIYSLNNRKKSKDYERKLTKSF